MVGVSGDVFLEGEGLSSPPRSVVEEDISPSSPLTSPPLSRQPSLMLGSTHAQQSLQASSLPPLFISHTHQSTLYLLSPYISASLLGCTHSRIHIGSVYGAVIVNGCEHLQVTVTCRKLVIINCLECTFHLACASSVVVIGDCRALYVGPLNSHYKNLPGHVKHAELASLLEGGGTNCWNMLCDVNHCLSDGATLSLEHNPQHRGVVFELPAPQAVMASLLPPEKFRVASVPVRGEHAGFESCPISLPREYRQQVATQRQGVEDVKQTLLSLIKAQEEDEDKASDEDVDTRLLSSSFISKKFMEWLVATDNVQEVLDLIRQV
eukprot:gene28381-34265_t